MKKRAMLNSIPAFLYPNTYSENTVPQLFESKNVVEFKELLLANTIQIDTMYQLLIQKEYFTEAEFLEKIKQVQADYGRVKEKAN